MKTDLVVCLMSVLLLGQIGPSYGDFAFAMTDMEGLITTEFEIVRHLENYIQDEESKLQRMKT